MEKFSAEFIKIVSNDSTVYSDFLCKFLQCETEQEQIMLFQKYHYSENQFYSIINKIDRKYNNNDLTIMLLNAYKNYTEYFHISKKKKNNVSYKNEKYSQIIDKVFESGLSKYEYCFNFNDINVSDVNSAIHYFQNNAKYLALAKIVESRDSSKVMFRINQILDKILTDDNYSIIDYFMETKLEPSDFKNIVQDNLSSKERTTVSKFFNRYLETKNEKLINMEKEYSSKLIIKNEEVLNEVKRQAYDFLKENKFPMTKYLYRECLRKIINGEIIIESRQLKKSNH